MSHQECFALFFKKWASTHALNEIVSFLSGRQMSVRVGSSWSSRRIINWGSPQGCILENALFCATIEHFRDEEYQRPYPPHRAALHNEKDSTIYAGGTILGDIIASEYSYLLFKLNGDSVDITVNAGPPTQRPEIGLIGQPMNFRQRIHISPVRTWQGN